MVLGAGEGKKPVLNRAAYGSGIYFFAGIGVAASPALQFIGLGFWMELGAARYLSRFDPSNGAFKGDMEVRLGLDMTT